MAVSSVVRITNTLSNISTLGCRGNQLGAETQLGGDAAERMEGMETLFQEQLRGFLCLSLPPGIKLLGEESLLEQMHPSSPDRTSSKTMPGWRKGSLLPLLLFAGSLTDT